MTHTSRIAVALDANDKPLLSKAQVLVEQDARLSVTPQDFAEFRSRVAAAFNPNKALHTALQRASKVKRD